jgi:hypothetical protein
MKLFVKLSLLLFPFFSIYRLHAQTKTAADYISVTGYIKFMGSLNFVDDVNSIYATTLIHNRIDLKIKPGKGFTIAASERTRILTSEYQNLVPGFAQLYSPDNGLVRMSFNWVNKYPLLCNTSIDRLYLEWKDDNDKWDIRVGRQRLNWGINLTWNPNDIFNTYNLLDFDYEERPGADAAKVQYNFTSFSNIEAAIAPARNKDSIVGAVKYAFNKHNYDLQFIAGNYCNDGIVGMGWAGNIKDAGFKGEISYFHGWTDNQFKNDAVSFSTTVDYSFKNGVYIAGSVLYNNLASNSIFSTTQLESENLSPKVLMPTKYNGMFQLQGQFSPIVSGNVAIIYAPVVNLLVVSPTISYSIATNFDLDFIVQSFYANNQANRFAVLGNSANLRFRWSFSN